MFPHRRGKLLLNLSRDRMVHIVICIVHQDRIGVRPVSPYEVRVGPFDLEVVDGDAARVFLAEGAEGANP